MWLLIGASRKTARAILVPQFPLIIIIESLICQNIYIIECMYIVDLEIANKYLSIYLWYVVTRILYEFNICTNILVLIIGVACSVNKPLICGLWNMGWSLQPIPLCVETTYPDWLRTLINRPIASDGANHVVWTSWSTRRLPVTRKITCHN